MTTTTTTTSSLIVLLLSPRLVVVGVVFVGVIVHSHVSKLLYCMMISPPGLLYLLPIMNRIILLLLLPSKSVPRCRIPPFHQPTPPPPTATATTPTRHPPCYH